MALTGVVAQLNDRAFPANWADNDTLNTINDLISGAVFNGAGGTKPKLLANATPGGKGAFRCNPNVVSSNSGATATGYLEAANNATLQTLMASQQYAVIWVIRIGSGNNNIMGWLSKSPIGANSSTIVSGAIGTPDGKARAFDSSSGAFPISDVVVANGNFRIVIFSFNGANVRITVDGELAATFTNGGTTNKADASWPLHIGCLGFGGFGGEMDVAELLFLDHPTDAEEEAQIVMEKREELLTGSLSLSRKLVVAVMGNSISNGDNTLGDAGRPVTRIAARLSQILDLPVYGVSGAVGGSRTAQWGPGGEYDPTALFASAGAQVGSLMPGTNDTILATAPPPYNVFTTPEQFKANLDAIIGYYFAQVPTLRLMVLHLPISPNDNFPGSNLWDATSVARLKEFHDVIRRFDNNARVRLGDTRLFGFFLNNPTYFTDFIHLNWPGYRILGNAHAQVIGAILQACGGGEISATLATATTVAVTSLTDAVTYLGSSITISWQQSVGGIVWSPATGPNAQGGTVTITAGATHVRRVVIDNEGRVGYSHAVAISQFTAADRTALATIDGRIDTEIPVILERTNRIPDSPSAVGSAMTLADGAVTAAKIATGAIDADALASDAVAEIAAGITPIAGLDYRGPATFVRLADSPGALLDTEVHVGENRWIPGQVVDANGKSISLDGYTLSATLTGSGGFSQTLSEAEIEKVVDENGLSIDGLFNWRATSGTGKLTQSARSNVRLTVTLTRISPATTINAHGRVQVVV